jgi:hypothetical protein
VGPKVCIQLLAEECKSVHQSPSHCPVSDFDITVCCVARQLQYD